MYSTPWRLCGALVVLALVYGYSPQPSTPRLSYGTTFIAGGYYFYEGEHYLKEVEVLGGDELPYLTYGLQGNSLTFMWNRLYSCGGNAGGGYSADCYTINVTAENKVWEKNVRLPMAMSYHTATVAGTHMWFIYDNILYDMEIASGKFNNHNTPFKVYWNHCTVTNQAKVFVIGVGEHSDQVWLNTNMSTPASWKQVATLPAKRTEAACLYFGDIIFITGGYGTDDSTLILDTNSFKITETGHLQDPRQSHGMYVQDGLPAVAGGRRPNSDSYIWSIETYNLQTGVWSKIDKTLKETKDNFGITQEVIHN